MVSDSEFQRYIEEGIDSLPDWVRRSITNVTFLMETAPSETQRSEQGIAADETLFGLYEGVPLTERGNDPPFLPDTITIFKDPILEAYDNVADIRTCVANTVWHEVAHYFGHDEDWVAREEERRGKIL